MAIKPKVIEHLFDDCVFINCPYDAAYKPLFDAILFTVHDCGFVARHALEATGGKETRLDKIYRLIAASRWSIHDVSRVEFTKDQPLPRFNMPFECGLAFGAMRYGAEGDRDALVMTGVRFQDKTTLSDLAGIDPGYHDNQPEQVIASVRKFLASKATGVPGHANIISRFAQFQKTLPKTLVAQGVTLKEVRSLDYINEWILFAVAWMKNHPR
jgi:hypothetical protein